MIQGDKEETEQKAVSSVLKRDRKKKPTKDEKAEADEQESAAKQDQESSEEEDKVQKVTEKQVEANKGKESSDEGAGFDDWENAIEDIADKMVKKTATEQSNLTNEEVASDEETKDNSKSQISTAKQPEKETILRSAFDVSDDQADLERRER